MNKKMHKCVALISAMALLLSVTVNSALFAFAANEWTVKKAANEYASISDASGFQQTDAGIPAYDGILGYRFSNGAKATGWVVYDAGSGMTDFKVTSILGHTDATGMLTFDVSNDNSTWTSVSATATQVNAEGRPGWPTFDYTGSSDTTFQYLRVNFVESAYNYDLLICNVYFKVSSEIEKPASYDVKASATGGTASGDGTLTTVEGEYYAFVDNNAQAVGTITWQSEYAITDYNFATLASGAGWGGTISFAASKDGQNWDALTPVSEVTSAHPNSGWGASYYDNYGALQETDGYKYLRASLNVGGGGGIIQFPSVAYVEYNTAIPAKPTNFNNKKYPTDATISSDTEGAQLKKETEDITSEYYTIRNADGTSLVNGSLIFQSKNAIESYNFATVESDTWNGNWSFSASADGKTWDALAPVTVKGEKTSSAAWGPCYKRDNYGILDKAKGYKYLRATVTTGGAAVPFPSIAYAEFYAEGLPDGVIEESEDIADLTLAKEITDFTQGHKNGVFKMIDSVVSTNNQNVDYFGAPNALIMTGAGSCSVIMYTPNVRDFKFTLSSTVGGDKLVVKAFGRKTQYGEETEIPLMRTGNIRPADKGEGTPWYQFRVADRANMSQDYTYVRIQVTDAQWTNCLNFTYFYDGPEPGDVPDDEQAEPEDKIGTERENVQTINANKGNLGYLVSDNMGVVANGGNAAFIGAKAGIVIYPDAEKDAWSVFSTEGISKFWVKFLVGNEEMAANFVAKFYVAPSADAAEDEWTQINAHIEACTDKVQPTGWKALEYVMDDDQTIPEGSNVLKVFISAAENNNIGSSCQIARVDYEFTVPVTEPLPEMAKPDATKGEKEMLEDFSGTQLLKENGGLAEEAEGIEWMMQSLGTDNGKDKVYYRDNLDADSYLVYHLNDVTSIDIRGYRNQDCEEDLLVYVSKDGEEWVTLDKFTRFESKLYSGPVSYAHRISTEDIPAGMNYVKVEIPMLAGEITDLTISDIQVLYNVKRTSDEDSKGTDNTPDTGVSLPLAALIMVGVSGAVVMVDRKRRVC